MLNKVIFLTFILITIVSCSIDPLKVDVSAIDVNLKISRMEQELFKSETVSTEETHQYLLKKYDALYQLFFENMLGEGSVHDPMAPTYLSQFIANADMQRFYTEIETKFNDFSTYEKEFNEAFTYYSYYFPDSSLPEIVTFYSNFNANALPIGDKLGIGLDMYLGKDNEIVKSIPTETLPQFIKDKMEAKYLVADGVKYWLFNRFYNDKNADFLSTIISAGKIMYLTDALLLEKTDAIKMGYSEDELQWCKDNEANIWQILVDEELLYSKNQKKIGQFTTNGPFTKGLPEESPAQVGIWVGWQMVRDYVRENNVSIVDLLAETNYRKILKSYNPNE